jgi:hypothetical protein
VGFFALMGLFLFRIATRAGGKVEG